MPAHDQDLSAGFPGADDLLIQILLPLGEILPEDYLEPVSPGPFDGSIGDALRESVISGNDGHPVDAAGNEHLQEPNSVAARRCIYTENFAVPLGPKLVRGGATNQDRIAVPFGHGENGSGNGARIRPEDKVHLESAQHLLVKTGGGRAVAFVIPDDELHLASGKPAPFVDLFLPQLVAFHLHSRQLGILPGEPQGQADLNCFRRHGRRLDQGEDDEEKQEALFHDKNLSFGRHPRLGLARKNPCKNI